MSCTITSSRPATRFDFARLVERVEAETLVCIEIGLDRRAGRCWPMARWCWNRSSSSPSRRKMVVSALGVREGLLYELLDDAQRARGSAARDGARNCNVLRSRSPQHGEELCAWTDRFMASTGLDETAEEKRLRHAACLLADIGWRAHPDYRGEQSLNIIAHAGFIGIDHPGRAYLALAVAYRHMGLNDDEVSPRLRELCSIRMLDRARILGGSDARRLSDVGRDARHVAARRPCAARTGSWSWTCRRAGRPGQRAAVQQAEAARPHYRAVAGH